MILYDMKWNEIFIYVSMCLALTLWGTQTIYIHNKYP